MSADKHICRVERINLSSTPDRAEAGDPWITGFLTPVCTIRCDSRTQQTTARVGQSIVRQWSDPLAALHWMSGTFWLARGGGSDISATIWADCLRPCRREPRMILIFRCSSSRIAAPPPTGRAGPRWITESATLH